MILRMIHGKIFLNKILTPEQLAFYEKIKVFTIHNLYHPIKNESVIVSFKEKVINLTHFKVKFYENYGIYFQPFFYDSVRQGSLRWKYVKVIILNNYDIIVSNNRDLEIDKDSDPIMEELEFFFRKGKEKCEAHFSNTNLKNIYKKLLSENSELIYKLSIKYRFFTDNLLDDSFYFRVFKKFFLTRRALRDVLKRESIGEEFSNILYSLISTFIIFRDIYKEERNRRSYHFAYNLTKNNISIQKFAHLYQIVQRYKYVNQLRHMIDKMVDELDINSDFKSIAFLIGRRIRTKKPLPLNVRIIDSIIISILIVDYYKKIKFKSLGEKLKIPSYNIYNRPYEILEEYGYDIKIKSFKNKKNINFFKDFVKMKLKIDYYTFKISLSFIEEMMEAIRTPTEKEKSEGTYFMVRYDPILLCLKKELEKAESYGYDIASHIPLEIKEEFILFLLDKYKRRRSLIEKKLMRLDLIKYVSNRLGYKISWEKLYKEQVFG